MDLPKREICDADVWMIFFFCSLQQQKKIESKMNGRERIHVEEFDSVLCCYARLPYALPLVCVSFFRGSNILQAT